MLLWEPDATLYQEIDSLNKGNMPDVSRLLKSLESLPVIPEEKLRAYSCFLSVVLDTMMQERTNRRKQLAVKQRL